MTVFAGRHCRILRCGFLLTAALASTAAAAQAQVIRGHVVDDATGVTVRGANVSLLRGDSLVTIGSVLSADGAFLFRVPAAGDVRLRVEALGYVPMTTAAVHVGEAMVVTVEVRIRVDAIPLTPLVVVAQRTEPPFMQDFRRRAALGFGRFITREQLDDRFGSRLQDVLRDAGLTVTEFGLRDGGPPVPLVTARLRGTSGRDCYADLYLNGVRQYSWDLDQEITWPRVQDLFQFTADDIEAIEIYRGAAEVPAEYSGSTAQCGVVAFWLRSGYFDEVPPVPLTAPVPAVRFAGAIGRHGIEGNLAPGPGALVEVSVLWRVHRVLRVGGKVGRGAYVLSEATAAELVHGTRLPPPGERPLSVWLVAAEARLSPRSIGPFRPGVGAELGVGRRSFHVPEPDLPQRRGYVFVSHGLSWAANAGIELPVGRGMAAELSASRRSTSFGRYPELSPRTAASWRLLVARLGLVLQL